MLLLCADYYQDSFESLSNGMRMIKRGTLPGTGVCNMHPKSKQEARAWQNADTVIPKFFAVVLRFLPAHLKISQVFRYGGYAGTWVLARV
jgi:hypothetical protein